MDGLSEHLFWDVRREGVDPELHAAWLVQRVLEYGRWRDWKLIETHYGKLRLAEIVVKIRCLEPRSFAFCCARFNLSPTLFRCSTSPQFPKV